MVVEEEEEEDEDDEDDYERSKHSHSTGKAASTTISVAPSDRVYRYQVRPVARRAPGSDAGSIALSDKYRRVGARSRRSDDQVGNEGNPQSASLAHVTED